MATKKAKDQSLEVKYAGRLSGAEGIYLHYGLGNAWDNVNESKMRKLKSCYKTEVVVPRGEKINFCFRDTNGNWDNNDGQDYYYVVGQEIEYSNLEVNLSEPKAETKKTTRAKV